MPKYRVLEKSFIDNRIVEEGSVVDYDAGPGIDPGPQFVEVDENGKEINKKAGKPGGKNAVDAAS